MSIRYDGTLITDPDGARYARDLARVEREMEAVRYLMELHIGRGCARCQLMEHLKREATKLLAERNGYKRQREEHRQAAAFVLAQARRGALPPGREP